MYRKDVMAVAREIERFTHERKTQAQEESFCGAYNSAAFESSQMSAEVFSAAVDEK